MKTQRRPQCRLLAAHVFKAPVPRAELEREAPEWKGPAAAVRIHPMWVRQAGCSAAGASCSNMKCFCEKDMGNRCVGEACDDLKID